MERIFVSWSVIFLTKYNTNLLFCVKVILWPTNLNLTEYNINLLFCIKIKIMSIYISYSISSQFIRILLVIPSYESWFVLVYFNVFHDRDYRSAWFRLLWDRIFGRLFRTPRWKPIKWKQVCVFKLSSNCSVVSPKKKDSTTIFFSVCPISIVFVDAV